MIVLDTNVLSEFVRGRNADPRVLRWASGLTDQPVTTDLNRAELLAGAALLSPGKRRDQLLAGIDRALSGLETCLPFTPGCSTVYAQVVATRSRLGRPVATMDALIAAVALTHGASVATRDIGGFVGVGLRLVDPWSDRPQGPWG